MHPLLKDASDGRLPDWAEASEDRVGHMARVADLMAGWAEAMALSTEEQRRWRAAAMLHDALRDADPVALRTEAAAEFQDLPGGMLHGPVTAQRLEENGVEDGSVIRAVRWHTMGHPELDRLGRALYLADYTEPGRKHRQAQRAEYRNRVPSAMDDVLLQVTRDRIERTLQSGAPLRPPTVAFWNAQVDHG